MATKKINYKDKAPLQTKPEIPGENKVNAEDLNQIKEVVNNNADEIELRQLKEEGKGLSKNDFTDELKAKLESLNNYNDTEIKKEINEINKKVAENTENDIKQDTEIETLKTNYTNLQEQNTKLEEQIKKDRENMINLEVEGQSIHIEDSSDLEGQLEVLGNVEQDVREGYNLYDYMSRVIATTKGLTVTKDTENGYLMVNGTPETDYTSITAGTNITDKIKDKTTYSLWQEKYDGKLFLQVNAKKKDDSGYDYFSVTSTKKDFTVDKSKYGDYTMVIQTGLKTQAGTFNNYKNRYMLFEGTEEKPYEPYGASPSPEYPSTVRAVGDNINLLENTAKTQTVNGVTFTVNEDGTVIANGTATSLAQISLVANLKLSAGTYTIKDAKAYVESEDFNDWFDGLNNPSTLTFNTEVLLKNVYIQVKQGETVNNKIFYPKLEKGTAATSCSKFGQGSVGIKKINKNLAPNLKEGKLEKQNTFICNCKKGESFTLSTKGTAEKDGRLFLRTNTDFAEGTDSYAEQKEITLDGTEQKTTITSTIDGFLYIRTGGAAHVYNFTYLQIEKGTVATEYVEHQEQTKILPIQKPMLEGDHFNRTDNKEVHTWKKIMLDGVNNKVTQETTATNGKYRYKYTDKDLKNCSLSEEKAYCTHLQLIEKNKTYDKIVGFTVSNGSLLIYTDGDTAVNFNTKLQKENYIFYIPVIESAYQKIDLTPKQIEVLDQLDNLETYKPVTNITTDSIAKLKLKYIADTKTYVDNKTSNLEQQVSVINQLLSTTKTSSILLDNLQKDIESEVL